MHTLSEHFISYLIKLIFSPDWSAAVAHLLRGLIHCVFRDALLHTTFVILVFFAVLLWPFSLTHLTTPFFPHRTTAYWMFFVFAPFSANSRDWLCLKIPLHFWDICLAPRIIPRSLGPHFFPFWSEKQPYLLTVSSWFYALCCRVIGWLNISIKMLVYKVLSEWPSA